MNTLNNLYEEVLSMEANDVPVVNVDELLQFSIESATDHITQALSFAQVVTQRFDSLAKGELSVESLQRYSDECGIMLQACGLNLPMGLLVPSFEAALPAVVDSVGEKKDGVVKRAVQAVLGWLKRLKAWVMSLFKKKQDVSEAKSAELKAITTQAKALLLEAKKTPGAEDVKVEVELPESFGTDSSKVLEVAIANQNKAISLLNKSHYSPEDIADLLALKKEVKAAVSNNPKMVKHQMGLKELLEISEQAQKHDLTAVVKKSLNSLDGRIDKAIKETEQLTSKEGVSAEEINQAKLDHEALKAAFEVITDLDRILGSYIKKHTDALYKATNAVKKALK